MSSPHNVAKSVLPEASNQVLRALAIYARSSARYLAAIDSISTRARYIAKQAARSAATTDDVRKAMRESVIPADSKLHAALEQGQKSKRAALASASASLLNQDLTPFASMRARTPSLARSVETPLVEA